jgi:CubicO group peptidase (beta-lactamase class C family)
VSDLGRDLNSLALASRFSGVVRVDEGDDVLFAQGYGLANRSWDIPNTLDTRFGAASGTKGFTALTIASLVEEGVLGLATTARAVLGEDLELIGDDVTVEHLLAHRSGIGDYLDEETDLDLREYLMPVPVHELATSGQYARVLEGRQAKFPAGARFSYCNSGYVVLAIIAERLTDTAFHDLVVQRVCEPMGLRDTAFLRSDELPELTAVGYLHDDGLRTNVFHLPVRGSGDGGIYTTVDDIARFWRSLFGGSVVPAALVAELVRLRSRTGTTPSGYGLGFWLDPDRGTVLLVGSDAGVSFATQHAPGRQLTATVISNTTDGALPLARLLRERFVSGE